jgi:putative FmdB family regulatory protein
VPIYEYRCPDGHVFETFHRMDAEPPSGCEVCGKGPLTKVLHPVPVFFKGSGFYSTDYGRGSRKREAAEGDGAAKKDEKKTDKTEKPEKKAAASES